MRVQIELVRMRSTFRPAEGDPRPAVRFTDEVLRGDLDVVEGH